MIKIKKMVNTCTACPAQWDGWAEDGTYYYFRYRWGHLSISKDEVMGDAIMDEDYGDPMSGFMTYKELRESVREIMTLPEEETRDEDPLGIA